MIDEIQNSPRDAMSDRLAVSNRRRIDASVGEQSIDACHFAVKRTEYLGKIASDGQGRSLLRRMYALRSDIAECDAIAGVRNSRQLPSRSWLAPAMLRDTASMARWAAHRRKKGRMMGGKRGSAGQNALRSPYSAI